MSRNRSRDRSAFHRFPIAVFTASIMAMSSTLLCAQTPKTADSNAKNSEAGDELDRGPIETSNSILHSKVVSQEGDEVGKIADLLLDLQFGHLSTVVIARRSPRDGEARLIAVPWRGLQRNKEKVLQLRCSAEKLAHAPGLAPKDTDSSLTRRWATSVYGHFGIQERSIPQNVPKPSEDYQLIRVTSLENVRVNDLSGTKLGNLAGFAIATRDGLLLYAAMAVDKSDDGLQAVPLSAFIVKPSQAEWLLDINHAILAERPGFSKTAWPATIDRGWSEYVHVLYGRPVFEGVRSAPKEAAAKP